ncbi:MAG: prephenate dehydrogenase/arogenate dehydrogenase family protein [Nitrospirota bacterium]|nr:prephenate dehydrogenase/arogenate dehydrogenase family protein [Nitrospirota bacterium]MDH4361119.1 prephenate dehydrogenase/arogenate dehydrogenase family protein [Nitrospirota bacterium]MDH5296232.1 prephenate dehydrogenase/arogenate dehydrogenase family protein [Nitrospirota bacterium]MDH5574749.1 prephenate dehydrogenase/arogenate dehydrogenase family protein [Nitrospirota bacterium]
MTTSPSEPIFRHVTIIGLGLLGGSLGLVLKEKGLAQTVVGIGRRRESLELAVKMGAIDRFALEPHETVNQSDLIVMATPVETYLPQIQTWGKDLAPSTIVSDVGSVKGQLVLDIEAQLPPSTFFVGAHPIAGKEKSGVAHADSRLFQGARCVVTPTPRTNAQALEKICYLWEAAGSVVLSMDPMEHDWVLGAVSHLPHVVAFSLMHTLQALQERTPHAPDLLDFSGGGLRDTTRIAASSPEMWRDICVANHENLVKMVDQYIHQLEKFRELLKNRDASGLYNAIAGAKESRERLV